MRCFISAELPEKIKKQIEELQKEFLLFKKYMRPVQLENIHITIKFFGDIKRETEEEINKSLEHMFRNKTETEATIKNIEIYPNKKQIKGIWIKLSSRELNNIKQEIEKIDIIQKQFPEKYKTYRIHTTLFRMNRIDKRTQEKIEKKIELINRNIQDVNFTIKNIELKESTLTPQGPIYSTKKRYILKNKK